jgi:protein-tyrosine phosphatase
MPQIYWFEIPYNLIGITKRPSGFEDLEKDIEDLKNKEVDIIVSCLQNTEIVELGLSKEEYYCNKFNVSYFNFPIEDRGVPESLYSYKILLKRLNENIINGKKVVAHCRMGIGRSSLITAGLLVLSGMRIENIFEKIKIYRKTDVPDTNEQMKWFLNNSSYILE